MRNYNLGFISDELIFNHVKATMLQYTTGLLAGLSAPWFLSVLSGETQFLGESAEDHEYDGRSGHPAYQTD